MQTLDSILNTSDARPLTKADEAELLKDWPQSKPELIRRCTRMAVQFAKQKNTAHTDLGDLIGAAMLGLCEGAEEYTPSAGRFATYVRWHILKRIMMEVERSNLRPMPGNQFADGLKLNKTENAMAHDLGRKPSPAELCRALGWSLGRYEKATLARQHDVFFDGIDTETEPHWQDKHLQSHDPEYTGEWGPEVFGVLDVLDDRSREIFLSRVIHDQNYQEIGDRHGISRERVRQILEKSFAALRHPARIAKIQHYKEAIS